MGGRHVSQTRERESLQEPTALPHGHKFPSSYAYSNMSSVLSISAQCLLDTLCDLDNLRYVLVLTSLESSAFREARTRVSSVLGFSYSCLWSNLISRTGTRQIAFCWLSQMQSCRRVLCLLFFLACGSWPEPPGSPVGCVGSLEPGKLASCPGGCEGRGDRQILTGSGQHAPASARRSTWTPTLSPGKTPGEGGEELGVDTLPALSALNGAFHLAHGPRELLRTSQPPC